MIDNPSAIRFTKLTKSYAGRPVLCGVDLCVDVGAAVGLVGINGAGKTTLIKCLLDFCAPDGGTIHVFGRDHALPAARSGLAYVPERFSPPHYLRGREFLEFMHGLSGDLLDTDAALRMLDELRLDRDVLDRPVRQLSKGMTQKLGLAGCFLAKRALYILDEPMSGLDPASRIAVKSVLTRLHQKEGHTLFFTSHVLADVEELCSSLAVLDTGRIRFFGAPGDLCARHGESNLERAFMRCINAD